MKSVSQLIKVAFAVQVHINNINSVIQYLYNNVQ